MQQSSVQHLASQMNQLQMSGSQYITSPVHGSFSQASWQMMHQHGQPQHPHTHYMSLEVRHLKGCFVSEEKYVSKSLNDASVYLWCCLLCCTKWFWSYFQVWGWNSSMWPIKWKLLGSTVYFAVKGGSNFLDKTLVCDHSKESDWAALSQCIVGDRVWFILHFRNIQLSAKGIPLGHPCHLKQQGYHRILLTTLSLWRNTEWRATHRLINKGEQCIWCSFHTR